jgi:septation ring formation regulator EzrA
MGWIADLFKEIPLSVNLQSKLDELEKKFTILEEENKNLKSKLEDATKEIDRLNKIIQSFHKDQATEKLNEIEENILKLLFDTNQEFYASNIASKFRINIGVAEYHINNLLKSDFIGEICNVMDDTCYYINANGRAYIVENT